MKGAPLGLGGVFILFIGMVIGVGIGTSDTSNPVSQPAATKTVTRTVTTPPKTVTRTVTPAPKTVTKTITAAPKPVSPPKPVTPPKTPTGVSQANAISSAQDYLKPAFSRSGLIDQLKYEGFLVKEAAFAVDSLKVNWNEQAAKSAKDYLSKQAFSRSGLIGQLKFEGFTQSQAVYGVNAVGLQSRESSVSLTLGNETPRAAAPDRGSSRSRWPTDKHTGLPLVGAPQSGVLHESAVSLAPWEFAHDEREPPMGTDQAHPGRVRVNAEERQRRCPSGNPRRQREHAGEAADKVYVELVAALQTVMPAFVPTEENMRDSPGRSAPIRSPTPESSDWVCPILRPRLNPAVFT